MQKLADATRLLEHILGDPAATADTGPHSPLSPHRQALRELVPRWHFAMLNDLERNALFREAIEAAVQPDDHVLDIGSGSGLLAMIAARSGAGRVTSCELVRPVATAAERIIAENGFADLVDVVNKRSDQLVVGADLPRQVDVIVTEVVDCGLVGEGVLPTLRHAREHLLRPGGQIVPHAARLMAMPVQSDAIRELNQVGHACGFDVRHFNAFATQTYHQVRLSAWPYRALAAPREILAFDFLNDSLLPSRHDVDIPVETAGVCHGIAFWFEMSLDKERVLSNGPHGNSKHWLQAFQCFADESAVVAGDTLRLSVVHSDDALCIERRTDPDDEEISS